MDPLSQVACPPENSVKHVLVLADLEKAGVRACNAELMPWLGERVEKVTLEGDIEQLEQRRSRLAPEEAARDLPDLVVVLGGDGAILGSVRAFASQPIPTLGINFGRVGFLASTPEGHWREALEGVLAGAGLLDPRMRLAARICRADGSESAVVALNDLVASRAAQQRMMVLGLHVEDEWVTDYRADGLIIATPSGSTAHSLSAGGPILSPSMLCLVVTPICPQGLSYRPIVLHQESRLRLVVKESSGVLSLAVDGQGFYELEQGDRVEVSRHPVQYPLLGWCELDPYRRLRERLGWSGLIAPDTQDPE